MFPRQTIRIFMGAKIMSGVKMSDTLDFECKSMEVSLAKILNKKIRHQIFYGISPLKHLISNTLRRVFYQLIFFTMKTVVMKPEMIF